ncbi:MAG: acetoacetate decarboxylase family protein [Chloroflexota bacterium]|nr:acetoacetate decarboxylase family protein [Chloroflexota bacterium]MDP6508392.1 acetoacetate decarboxylase family protein [Chloroflexota bacterium]MDP6758331.1 acetoacetate decarboxylase family protein [Chloroflexota bacterium]
MPYELRKRTMYMMPTHFGPQVGPVQGPGGELYAFDQAGLKREAYAVSFRTKAAQLEAMLPPGFALDGEPVVTVVYTYMTEIDWLAGRGYNTLGVTFAARYAGVRDRAAGPLMLVLWENLCDPILIGREQLGFSKIYCELPDPVVREGETSLLANWMGFRFMDMTLTGMEEVPAGNIPVPADPPDDGLLRGLLHYKYVPKTGDWGEPEAEYAVMGPPAMPANPPKRLWCGDGTVEFHRARWEDLPTQYQVVNGFADLEVEEFVGATIEHGVGGKGLGNQVILE